jgi:hypothetical protein
MTVIMSGHPPGSGRAIGHHIRGACDPTALFEGIVDGSMNIGVALVGVRLVADIDLLSIRQGEVDMDLEEAAGPVMLSRIFHHQATGRNPAISFLKRRHVPRDLRVQRFLGRQSLR